MPKAASNKEEPVSSTPAFQEILDSATPNERIDFLDAHAFRVKECEYRAPLTDDEIGEVKDFVTRLSIKAQELEDEKQRFMDDWKVRSKAVEEPLEEAIREARTRERVGFGKVWDMVDHNSKTLYRIAEGNLIVSTRKADAEELAPRLSFQG